MNRIHALAPSIALAIVAACSQAPEQPGIRDVRPNSVEIGEKLLIETNADDPSLRLLAGAPVKVTFSGAWITPGKKRKADWSMTLDGRATAPAHAKESTRVLVDVDEFVEETVGGHSTFHGTITIEGPTAVGGKLECQRAPDGAITGCLTSGRGEVAIDFFPRSVRKLAYGLVGGKEESDLLEWLGMDVEPLPDDKGVKVAYVRQKFNIMKFIAAYDCGNWVEAEKQCRGGPDAKEAKVHLGEALRKAKTPAEEAHLRGLFAELVGKQKLEPTDYVTRTNSEVHKREASPAAVAGLREGDVIVRAAIPTGDKAGRMSLDGKGGFACDPAESCRPVAQPSQLVTAWAREGLPSVSLGVMRGDVPAVVDLPRYGKPAAIPSGFLLGGILVAVGLLVIIPIPLIGGLIVVWERKIAGRMQSRPGPNRVGPNGWLQFLADGIKLIVKEDIVPAEADPYLFRASPYLVFIGVFATFVVVPFSQTLIVADLNIGVLYLLSVTSLTVVGIIMGGWASNSKWSLLGGMRSAAQIISYELPASIAVLSVVVMAGTLSTQGIVKNQGGAPWNWHVFDNPFTFACFFIYFISALAEGNRTPFDLPEAESELVAGYNTEYSGFRFSIYFLAEWVNLVVIGAVATTVFLGGWHIPGVSPTAIEASTWLQLASAGVFAAKVIFLVFVIIWIRWTLPRFRVDQMMNMCWKYFLPISLVSFIVVSAWVAIAPAGSLPRTIMHWVMFGVFGVGILVYFISRVIHVVRTTKVMDLRGA